MIEGQKIRPRHGVWLVAMSDAPTEADDRALVAAWRAGEASAGEALLRRHFSAVYGFVRRRVGDADTATDIAQRTFMVCVEKRERIDAGVRFRAYVLGIARNLMMRHARDTSRRRAALAAAAPGQLASVSLVTPSRVVAQRQEHALLLTALRTLPEDLQATLELYYWEDLTTTEIGAVLGVAAGTIKWRLSRARALLRERVATQPAPVPIREATLDRLEHWARSMGSSREGDASA